MYQRDVTIKNGEEFKVHQVRPDESSLYARPIMSLVNRSWSHRLQPALSAEAIDAYTSSANPNNVQRTVDGIEGKTNPMARYTVATTIDNPLELLGLIRIDTYVPRNRFKPNYPNITDLEVSPPTGQHSLVGAALLKYGLRDFDSKQAISLYSESINTDGNAWFEQLGFQRTGNEPQQEIIPGETITYVQFSISRYGVAAVRDALHDQYRELSYH